MSPPPVRLLSKAIFDPSGENAGSRSLPGPWLTCTPFAPSGSAVTMRALGSTHAKPPLATGVAARAEPAPATVTDAATTKAHRHRVIVQPSHRPFVRTVTLPQPRVGCKIRRREFPWENFDMAGASEPIPPS